MTELPEWVLGAVYGLGVGSAYVLVVGWLWTWIHVALHGGPRPGWPDELAISVIVLALGYVGLRRAHPEKWA